LFAHPNLKRVSGTGRHGADCTDGPLNLDRLRTTSEQSSNQSRLSELAAWLTAGKSKIYAELAPETGEPLASTVAAFLKS